jgi:hypothetical protein
MGVSPSFGEEFQNGDFLDDGEFTFLFHTESNAQRFRNAIVEN